MRIVFLDQYSESGGAQLCLGDVLQAVADWGWQGELWAPGDGALHGIARSCGFETRLLPLRDYTNGRKSMSDVIRYVADAVHCRKLLVSDLRERPVDVIYVNGPRALPAVAGLHVPVLFHSHSVLDKRYSRWIARWSLEGGRARILASSHYLGTQLRKLFGPHAVRVVYNGVPDYGRGHLLKDHASPDLRVGIVGRIAPEKGQLEFLQMAHLLAGHGGLRFVVVGQGMFSAPGYEGSVRRLGESLGVEFTGWLHAAEIYRKLDILAVPSAVYDANPRVIIEAMSAGTCVVAYRSGGISELVTNGHDGLLTERNPEALASAIRTLADDVELQKRLRTNGRKTFERRFTVPRFQKEVCEAIAGLVGGRALDASEWRSVGRETGHANEISNVSP